MSAQDQLIKKKQRQNFTIADHVSIATDKDGNRRIVVSMPIDEEVAKVLLKGSNKKQVLAELDSKLAKLSPEMKQQIEEEFNKLVELGFFVNVKNLPADMQEELLNSPILFYISLAPSFKMESLSTKARCNLNASRGNALGHSLNSLLPQGMTQPNMSRSVRRFKLDKIGFLGDVSKFFNSSYLDSSSYKYNMLCYRNKQGEVEDCSMGCPARHRLQKWA